MAALLAEKDSLSSKLSRSGENIFSARAIGKATEVSSKLYVGPKYYDELRKLGFQLHRAVDLGFFSFLAHQLMGAIRLFYRIFQNWGLAIILLTLLIKLAFLPLTSASFKSMQAMQDLQPEMKALKERIKDPTQLNQEMMALYKRRGVKPYGRVSSHAHSASSVSWAVPGASLLHRAQTRSICLLDKRSLCSRKSRAPRYRYSRYDYPHGAQHDPPTVAHAVLQETLNRKRS